VDSDHDGVDDVNDNCPNTPAGVVVDTVGCPLDGDNDGVYDSDDKCPNTPAGVSVDASGCALDSDGDGVSNVKDECPNTALGVAVDNVGCPLDGDHDGVYDANDQCPQTPSGVIVDARGCAIDSDGDGVADYKDKCPGTLKGFTVDPDGCPEHFNLVLPFKSDSSAIETTSVDEVKAFAEFLKENPAYSLKIIGHTDYTGSQAHNQKLSEARAKTVFDILNTYGIEASRMRIEGRGEMDPIADNKTVEGRAKNRRIQVELLH